MKYGDTLNQRSIAAWQTHNIDYQDIKHFIKINTTPGKGKALSIPGSADAAAQDFENSLFGVLREQDERITLFVRSKTGEIQRRLAHLEDQIERFIVKASVSRTTVRHQERYGRLETDILKVGEEIQALSRFIGVQQEAFRKLIKKYKKWTGSSELGYLFNVEVRQKTFSFVHTDLKPLLTRYEELLHAVRLLHQRGKATRNAPSNPWLGRSSSTSSAFLNQAAFVLDNGKPIDFDKLLATMALGEGGKEVCYWVHPENVVELQILLQQFTRSFNALCRRPSVLSLQSPSGSPNRNRAALIPSDTFDIIIDDADDYLSANTVQEPALGARLQKAALHARGVSDEETCLLTWEKEPAVSCAELESCAIKRKCLRSVLTPGLNVVSRKASLPQLAVDGASEDPAESLEELQSWLKQHSHVSPIASIFSQRARFYNIPNDVAGILVAALDSDVQIQSGMATQSDGTAIGFPYAVLTVRQEGIHTNAMTRALDESHLVERIHDFSLEYHAIHQVQQPSHVEAPYWMPLVKQDLRKMPKGPKKPRRKPSNEYGSQSTTPRASTADSSDGDPNSDLSRAEDMKKLKQATMAHAAKQRANIKRQRTQAGPQTSERYWNEYDDPSDEEDGYVIYLDPNYESFWDKTWRTVKQAFEANKDKPNPERQALLYSPDLESGGSLEDTESSDDELDHHHHHHGRPKFQARPTSSIFAGYRPPMTLSTMPRLTLTCFASSIAILVVAIILAATGKRKLHTEVDAGVIFAIATSLAFGVTGVGSLYHSRGEKQALVWAVAGLVMCFIAAANGGLLAWILS